MELGSESHRSKSDHAVISPVRWLVAGVEPSSNSMAFTTRELIGRAACLGELKCSLSQCRSRTGRMDCVGVVGNPGSAEKIHFLGVEEENNLN